MTWMNRCLFQGPRVAVVTTERQFRAALRVIDAAHDADPFCEPEWLACTHAFSVAGEMVCVVGLNLVKLSKLPAIDAAATLVHEAVHVWQRTRACMGPGELGVEMEAYAIQNISAELMKAFVKASFSEAAARAGI